MVEEDHAKLQDLKAERSHYMDVNREVEFEFIMLEEARKTMIVRDKQKCEDVKHKIETLKLN